MADEATAACRSLSQQCFELGQLVGKFQLDVAATGAKRDRRHAVGAQTRAAPHRMAS
jgi:hypothetical protein